MKSIKDVFRTVLDEEMPDETEAAEDLRSLQGKQGGPRILVPFAAVAALAGLTILFWPSPPDSSETPSGGAYLYVHVSGQPEESALELFIDH